MKKVQVKATGCKTKRNVYQVSLKSCGGTKGSTYKRVIDTNIDYLFIFSENLEMYLIPKDEIKNHATLNLCKKYSKYKVQM